MCIFLGQGFLNKYVMESEGGEGDGKERARGKRGEEGASSPLL